MEYAPITPYKSKRTQGFPPTWVRFATFVGSMKSACASLQAMPPKDSLNLCSV